MKIVDIIDKDDSKISMCNAIIITTNYILMKEIKQILQNPEENIGEMREVIEDFSAKHY